MAKAARQSKFRHVYGEPGREELQYSGINNPLTAGEGQYVVANSKFFAVAKAGGGGGGPVYIRKLTQPGRFNLNSPMLHVHKGRVMDFDFHPFVDNIIATTSEDCRVCVTQFPMGGLVDTISQPSVTLEGHQKKVALCTFNPVANSILATGAFDRCIKIWNIETADCVASYDGMDDSIYSLAWNFNGSQLAVTGKDKQLRIYDPRDAKSITNFECFDGSKSSKLFWIPNYNWIGATGFSKVAKRQLKIWDLKNLQDPIYKLDIDPQASVLMPYYDSDHCILYLAGKGDGTIQYSEIVNDDRKVYTLSLYRDNNPQKGGGWVWKKGLDVQKCEIARFLKLTQKSVIPISFIVPRKTGAEIFQEDLYPDTYAGIAALQANEWLEGQNKDPILMGLDPSKRTDREVSVSFEKKKTYADLQEENEQLRVKIQELENELFKFKGNNRNDDDNNNNNNDQINQEISPRDDNNNNNNDDDNEIKGDD